MPSKTIGEFLNELPSRQCPKKDISQEEYLEKIRIFVRSVTAQAKEKGLGFLLEELTVETEASENKILNNIMRELMLIFEGNLSLIFIERVAELFIEDLEIALAIFREAADRRLRRD